jgi:polysaccharide export outer membrane protein
MWSEVHEGNQGQDARQREHQPSRRGRESARRPGPPTAVPAQWARGRLAAVPAQGARGRLAAVPAQRACGRRPAILTVALATLACSTTLPPVDYSKEPDPRQAEYVVGPSDVLRVNVWKTPDLSVEVTVRPDGTITLPLIGDLMAAGRTPTALRADIKRQLGAFLKDDNPAIEVIVQSANSYRFTVAGNVERAGLFTAKHFVTVTEAIALAGGPNRYADLTQVVIIRRDGSGSRSIPVSVKKIFSGQRPDMDLVILSEDRIFVP